jgi:glycosyltransferase involved in cell wall biosynthesis
MYRSADRVLVMTPQERWSLLNYAPNLQISVVPSGVDALRFRPPRYESTEQCIMFTGYYCDKPNEDAALWFGNKVWPQLRERHAELKFYMVGPEPTDAMREMARRDKRMIITGRVKDIRDYLARAQIFVCPVRLGTGMRGKIIEAMAGGVPLVSTTLGVEGIPAQTGYNCFLADRPDIMLRHIDLLLGDPPLRRSIAKRAREMVVERFSWRHVIALLDQVLQETVPGTGR